MDCVLWISYVRENNLQGNGKLRKLLIDLTLKMVNKWVWIVVSYRRTYPTVLAGELKQLLFKICTGSGRRQRQRLPLWRRNLHCFALAFAMADHFLEVSLPPSVEQFLFQICEQQNQPLPDAEVRWALASMGEEAALDALHKISCTSAVRNLSGFILHMVRNDPCTSPQNKMVRVSPRQSPSSSCHVSQLQSPPTCSVSMHQSPSTCCVYSSQGSLFSLFRAPVIAFLK